MNSEEQNFIKLNIGNKCTIYEAAELHKSFENILQKDFAVELDVSSVEEVDASFIQLLASAHIQANNKGVELKITGLTEQLTNFVSNIYCQEVLNNNAICSTIEVNNNES